jgi:hypothetical protein
LTILRRCIAILAVASLALAASALACSGSSSNGSADGGKDSNADVRSKDVTAEDVRPKDSGADSLGDAGPLLTDLKVTTVGPSSSPLTLVPLFSPSINDYYVRCPGVTNTLSVSMTASPGAESLLLQPMPSPSRPTQTVTPLAVNQNQAIVAAATGGSTTVEYWVRCLPSDFPEVQMVGHPKAGTPTPGYYLVGTMIPLPDGYGYAMVLDGNGVPVWYHREMSGGACDVDDVVTGAISYVPCIGGLPFEVFPLTGGEANAAPATVPLDIHELQVDPDGGNYLVVSNPNQSGVDLTGLNFTISDGGTVPLGANSNINDCNVVEFNPATSTVTWSWSALAHFDPATDTVDPELAPPLPDGGVVFDTFHCNSIDIDPANGNLLISSRQMNSVFYVEKASGKVLWKMGGSTASLDNAIYIPVTDPFFGQHDARLQPGWSTCNGGQISVFDDQTYGPGPARGVVYDVHLGEVDAGCGSGTPGATVAWQYKFDGGATSAAAGSVRISGDGGTRVIGWGLLTNDAGSIFTEVDDKGNDLLDLTENNVSPPTPNRSYRAIKVPTKALDLNAMRMTAGQP